MIAKYPGPCRNCGVTIERGAECKYNADTKTIQHWECADGAEGESPDAEKLADELGFA